MRWCSALPEASATSGASSSSAASGTVWTPLGTPHPKPGGLCPLQLLLEERHLHEPGSCRLGSQSHLHQHQVRRSGSDRYPEVGPDSGGGNCGTHPLQKPIILLNSGKMLYRSKSGTEKQETINDEKSCKVKTKIIRWNQAISADYLSCVDKKDAHSKVLRRNGLQNSPFLVLAFL